MKYLKSYEQNNNNFTIYILNKALSNFLFKLNNILPSNDNYSIKINSNSIHITHITNKTKKKIVGIISTHKKDIFTGKSKFGINIYKKIFIINLTYISTEPYINTIINYIANNIKFNKIKPIIIKNTGYIFDETCELKFDDSNYNQIIDNINKLSIEDLETHINADKYNI